MTTSIRAFAAQAPQASQQLTHALMDGRPAAGYLFLCAQEHRAEALATAFVRALLCRQRSGRDGCGDCDSCRKLAHGNHADVVWPTQGAEPHWGVAAVRAFTERLQQTSREGGHKVGQIFAAGRLKSAAQNSLLKAIEEPVGPTCFVLTTNRLRALLPTLRSRLQTVQVPPLSAAEAEASLTQAGVEPLTAAWAALARGDDAAWAQLLAKQPLAELIATLGELLADEADPGGVHAPLAAAKLAQSWGKDPGWADVATLVLEVLVRDALLVRLGAPSPARAAQLRWASAVRHLAERPLAALEALADAVLRLRSQAGFAYSRALALEGTFVLLRPDIAS